VTGLKQRLLVEWRKLDYSIVFAAISKWYRRLCACVRGSWWIHWAHFVIDSWFSVST